MTIEHSKISAGQFMFSIACFLHSSSLLTSFFVPITKQDSWIAHTIAMILCIPLMILYAQLAKSHPGLNLIQINEAVFGKVLGKIISLFYVWFFFTLVSLNMRDLGNFVSKTTMIKTPMPIIIILFILLCVWSAYYGLEVVTRYSTVFLIISAVILLISIIAITGLINPENFLPVFDLPIKNYIQVTHICSTIPFGETVIFLMITPYVDKSQKKLLRYFVGGLLIGGILILLVMLRDIAVLGNTIGYFSLPSFEAFRLGILFQTISHMEIMFSILLIILLYFKISFLFYASMLSLSQTLELKTYRPLLLPCAAFVAVYSIINYQNILIQIKAAQETIPFLWFTLEILLPALTLAVHYIKKSAAKKGNGKEAALR